MGENYFERIGKLLRTEARQNTKINKIKSDAVEEVDFDMENNTSHDSTTNQLYKGRMKRAILQRGQYFFMKIKFCENYQVDLKKIKLRFYTGKDPKPGTHTKFQIPITETKQFLHNGQIRTGTFWGARVHRWEGRTLQLVVQTDAIKTPIGIWRLTIVIDGKPVIVPEFFYLLFNPNSIEGGVYVGLAKEDLLEECIRNEDGILYKGRYDPDADDKGVEICYWNYGQCSCAAALPAAIYTLEKVKHEASDTFGKPALNFADPITVSRAMSFIAHEYIIEGNWNTDGCAPNEHPEHWKGSAAILTKFMNNFQPVKYGQCWVIAAIACTLCRAIGIPCRPVTVYDTAHSGSATFNLLHVARFKNETGGDIILSDEKKDYTWNFHVWIECWLARPDLPHDDYSGWQAVETISRNGISGPTSVKAVKEGDIEINYDVHEIFSEMNSDALFVKRYDDKREEITGRYSNIIGAYIVTKAIGEEKIRDITQDYKHEDGSIHERKVYDKAFYKLNNKHFEDIAIDEAKMGGVILKVFGGGAMIGKPVMLGAILTNNENETRTIDVTFKVSLVDYTNSSFGDLAFGPKNEKEYKTTIKVDPGKENNPSVEITPEQYMTSITGEVFSSTIIYVGVNAYVQETGKSRFKGSTVIFRKPELRLDIREEILKVDQPFDLHVSFDNPFDKELKKCFFGINSNIFKGEITHPFRDVAPKEKVEHKISLKPVNADVVGLTKYAIRCYFDSNLLRNSNNSIGRICKLKETSY